MNNFLFPKGKYILLSFLFSLLLINASAQTQSDALMIPKNSLFTSLNFTNSHWDSYWEGTFKRTNGNIGTLRTDTYSLGADYGISNRLNVLVSIPYVVTHASAGTLAPQQNFQDLEASLKWVALKYRSGDNQFRLITMATAILPITSYQADFLPMSIGPHSKGLMATMLFDYQVKGFFITASGSYNYRSTITIDRNAYYTNTMHYSRQVDMPDQLQTSVRTGLRLSKWIAELVAVHRETLGGFDIRKNDSFFPSNRINTMTAGVNFKYASGLAKGLEISAGADRVLSGRNAGQASIIHAGIIFQTNFSGHTKIGSAR